MSLLLVRHGETALNRARVVQPADTPLSALGLSQAQALAERLASEFRVAAVLSSDLPRAMQTAGCAARRLGLSVELEPMLAERNYGELRGRSYDSLGFDPLTMSEAPVQGESLARFAERVEEAFARMCAWRDRCDGDLLVVTHGLVLRELAARHLLPAARPLTAPFGNASITVVDFEPPFQVRLQACEAHLAHMESPESPARGIAGI